eukprot:CFRG5606T1
MFLTSVTSVSRSARFAFRAPVVQSVCRMSTSSEERKTTKLKNMLVRGELDFLMEAHNGLTAKIVEETGFKGIWGSGLSISAQHGVRDSNELSWTQVVDTLEFMAENTTIPILLDGDTGFGNFNNARRLARKLEERGVAGVCIEDKLFPKTNSLLDARAQPLADPEEFGMKIKAMKDSVRDPDFCVVARVESFIAGWGLDETIKRAKIYADYGADAVLIHSKKHDPSDIVSFMESWDNRCPVVIVPTNYHTTPTDDFRKMGISTIIWANMNVRASIQAVQNCSKQIFEEQSLVGVTPKIATVKEIFRLQDDNELKTAEKKYLPQTKSE